MKKNQLPPLPPNVRGGFVAAMAVVPLPASRVVAFRAASPRAPARRACSVKVIGVLKKKGDEFSKVVDAAASGC